MTFNINANFTEAHVAALIASGDDSTSTQLRVSDIGTVYLSKSVGNSNLQGVRVAFETFGAGNDYVGPQAAADAEWVGRIFRALKENWPSEEFVHLDVF